MGLTPVKTPWLVKRLFSEYIWDMPSSEKVIYLTFDDGPTPQITNWTLKILKQHNAKATFFCIGNNIEKHPDIFKNILEAGHAIGNHSQNHIKGWKTNTEDYLRDIKWCESVLKSTISNSGFKVQNSSIVNNECLITNLFRPPYGLITPKQGKALVNLGYKIIMWDVLSFDWEKAVEREKCLKNVRNNSTAGSVIVFHDSFKASNNMQYALPKVLKHFSEKGYRFDTLKL